MDITSSETSAPAAAVPAPAPAARHPLATVDPQHVLERYLNGETGPQIAASYGVTRQALSLFLISKAEAQYKDYQLAKALQRKDDAEALMDSATNALDITRAREQLRGAQWDLERVCRRIYGTDAPPAAAIPVAIQINLHRATSSATIAQEQT